MEKAEKLQPDNLEMKYWHAVSLVNIGKIEKALPKFNEIFLKDNNWRILTPRLAPLGLLNVNNQDLEKILQLQ